MDNELYHYGVLGQKWGVRRYQNADGTLTAEGRKRYNAERKTANKEAFNIGQEATIYGRATKYALNRAAKLEDRTTKKYEKDPEGLKKSTQRAREKAEAAEQAALKISAQYEKSRKEAEAHVKKLMEKYGKENVQDIKYKDVKLSKSASQKLGKNSIRVMDEETNTLADYVTAGVLSIGSSALSSVMGLPVAVLYYPSSANQKGANVANEMYIQEYSKKQQQRYGW